MVDRQPSPAAESEAMVAVRFVDDPAGLGHGDEVGGGPSSRRLAHMGRLAAGVAHDFNNILTVVGMRLERLAGRVENAESEIDVAEARSAVENATRLVSNLMALVQLGEEVEKPVDVNVHLGAVSHLISDLLGDRIELDLRLEADHPVVRLNESRLTQIAVNLAVNARESMPGAGQLTISTVDEAVITRSEESGESPPPGCYVRVDVTDTGEGVDPTIASQIFEPFFTTKQRGLGSGLGLATVRENVGRAGGFLAMRSGLGVGSTFSFWLPLDGDRTVDWNDDEGNAADREHERRATVLLVEDEPDLRAVLESELRDRGYTVSAAATAESALEMAVDGPQVLVTDLGLPGMRGGELAQLVQSRWEAVQVVFMTGQASWDDDSLPSDATLLIKPFTVDRLDATIRSVLGS